MSLLNRASRQKMFYLVYLWKRNFPRAIYLKAKALFVCIQLISVWMRKKIDTRALYARGEQQQWSDDKYFISNYFAIIYFTLKAVKTAAKWNMHDSQSQYTSCFLSHCSSKKKESSQGTIEKRLRWMLIPWLNSLSIRSALYLHSMYPLGDFVEKKNIFISLSASLDSHLCKR